MTLLEKKIFYLVLGEREHFVLKKSVSSKIFPKSELFWKSDFVGPISMMMIVFDHIYIIVLPKRKVR